MSFLVGNSCGICTNRISSFNQIKKHQRLFQLRINYANLSQTKYTLALLLTDENKTNTRDQLAANNIQN